MALPLGNRYLFRMSDLRDRLDQVADRESFLAFVRALETDRKTRSQTWENSTIEDFLEAARAWAEDSRELPTGLPRDPSWRAFATFLYCGKIYRHNGPG
jgi:hypothetical protein